MVRKTKPHLFCCLNGKHPHTTLPFLVLVFMNATDSTVCPPIWWCLPPDATILGGFIIYGQRCIMVTQKQLANLEKGKGYFARTTKEQQRSIAKKGKMASDISKAEAKSYRECAKYISELAVKDPKEIQNLEEMGISKDEMTQAMALTFAMITKAKKGNSQMARLVMELMGQVKEQQTNVTINNTNPYANLTEEELRKLADMK